MLSDRCMSVCLSCPAVLSVTFVYCGQKVGQIKTKLGMQVGLGPDHIVLDGDPGLPSPNKGQSPPPIFVPCLLCPNGSMDQDATWCGGRPQPKRHCVSWGAAAPPKRGQTPNCWPMSIVAKRLHGSNATWYGGRPRPRPHCAR